MTGDHQPPTISRRRSDGPTRLSFPQERLFLLDRIMPGLGAYNVPTLVRVGAHLDEHRLGAAFELVVARHEILRTRMTLLDGVPMQETFEAQPFQLTVADLRAVAPEEAQARSDELLGELAGRPFDLSGDVLLRAALVHVGAEEDLLLVVFHHMGSDHVSGGLLFAELDAAYRALSSGAEPELPELPIQYADFAEWQRGRLEGDFLQELLDYWTDQLRGAPDRLDLPTDYPRPSAQSYRGRWKERRIAAELVDPCRELARSRGVSLFMLLTAVFKTLLHRHTGAEDVVVGTPVSGRHQEETASLLGFFSNTLALRTDLSGDPTFVELLERVKLTTLGGLAYQELPFEKLVEVLRPERARSHSPLFQVLFGFDVAPAAPRRIGGCEVEPLPVPGWEWSRFDLSIVLREVPDGSLHVHVGYATDLFAATTIDRMLGHFQTLLRGVAAEPDLRLSELPILTDQERQQMANWNSTERAYERRCLHDLFSAQAELVPDAVAVIAGPERLTYGELDRASNRLARELGGLGVGPGDLVGISLDRSPQLITAMLGVLKSGAGYVPIEPSYPPERQAFMLADSRAPVLITQQSLLGVAHGTGATAICIDGDRDRERIAAHSGAPLDGADADPEQLAYVIYTSGSTGRPKGVEIRHRSVVNLIDHMQREPGIGRGDVLANLTTPAFDLSVPDWYLPLLTGARLVMVPREAAMDGVELADWLTRMGATFVQATPTTWQLLVDAGWDGTRGLKIVCGGEALPRALADELLTRGASLWHMYGPTETTVWSSVLELEPGQGPIPLGGPIANTTFHIFDQARQLVPIGVPGELYIGGDGVAAGYHQRDELTAEKFVEDPFGGAGRLYRTGDLLRWREDGTLEFHGRIDQQIKLRGFRIELGEIEAVLDDHPDVGGSVATVRGDTPGEERLIAYVVPAAETSPDVEALRRLVRTKLPPFMVPSVFVTLDAFPVTANGKLNRAALPAPDGTRPDLADSYAPPQTPVQTALASIWGDVLGIEQVGIDDDFFELGGHSLLAMKMLARVQESIGVDLNIGQVFEHSTIRDLSAAIAAELIGAEADDELSTLLGEIESAEL